MSYVILVIKKDNISKDICFYDIILTMNSKVDVEITNCYIKIIMIKNIWIF